MMFPVVLIKPPAADVMEVDKALTMSDVVSPASDKNDPPLNVHRYIPKLSDVTGPAK